MCNIMQTRVSKGRPGTSWDNLGRDIPLSLCTGTKKFPCPAVPLFGTKKVSLSRCPFVTRQEQQEKSCNKLFCPRTKKNVKKVKKVKNVKKCQIMSKNVKKIIFTLFSLLSHGCPGIFRDGTDCRDSGLAHPIARYQNLVPDRSVSRFCACPVIPGQ